MKRPTVTAPDLSAKAVGSYGKGRTRWEPTCILYDGGPGEWSAAEGSYGKNRECRLGVRWNGRVDDRPYGYPSHGATRVWFVVPRKLAAAIKGVIKAQGKS